MTSTRLSLAPATILTRAVTILPTVWDSHKTPIDSIRTGVIHSQLNGIQDGIVYRAAVGSIVTRRRSGHAHVECRNGRARIGTEDDIMCPSMPSIQMRLLRDPMREEDHERMNTTALGYAATAHRQNNECAVEGWFTDHLSLSSS